MYFNCPTLCFYHYLHLFRPVFHTALATTIIVSSHYRNNSSFKDPNKLNISISNLFNTCLFSGVEVGAGYAQANRLIHMLLPTHCGFCNIDEVKWSYEKIMASLGNFVTLLKHWVMRHYKPTILKWRLILYSVLNSCNFLEVTKSHSSSADLPQMRNGEGPFT